MCNEINHSVCYTTATYEVHTFKNKNKRKYVTFHDGGRYHIETSPLICFDWFLYDIGLRHERVKIHISLSFSDLYLFIRSCKVVMIETRAYEIA